MFFALHPAQAYISDINPELVNAYRAVKDEVEALIEALGDHKYEEEYFYKIRDVDRTPEFSRWTAVQKAARIIYLNKTCYNGLFRVNSKGQFNTPFGRYSNPIIVDAPNLRACSAALRTTEIALGSFELIENIVREGDFIYFDPPYVPLTTTANFTGYSQCGFDLEMQHRLFDLCSRLAKRHIRWLLSNSSAAFVTNLYHQFNIEFVEATRAINSKADSRGKINEVLISNFC